MRSFALLVVLAACGREEPAPGPALAAPAPPAPPPPALSRCATCTARVITRLPATRAISLALDGEGTAYVAELFGNHIFAVDLATGTTRTLYTSPSRGTWGVQVLGDDVLWSSNDTGRIYAAPRRGGGAIRVFADHLVGVGRFRIAGDALYWCDVEGSVPGAIWKRPLAGGPSIAVPTPAKRAMDVVPDGPGGDVVLADDDARVLRVAADGKVAAWVDIPGDVEIEGLAAGARAVYVSSLKGALFEVDLATGHPELLVAEPGVLYAGVATDRDQVYWLDYMNPRLFVLAR